MIENNDNIVSSSVTPLPIKNTHCIICGAAFTHDRAGKLYCSSRCRQSGYYHKDKILILRKSQFSGISREILTFKLKEYKQYCIYRERIINYRRLESQFGNMQAGSPEWDTWYKNPNCALNWERKKIPKKIIDLKPIYLSVEKWSFLKSLYPKFALIDFIDFVCTLSTEFIQQLTISENERNIKNTPNKFPIKNRYLYHLTKIVNGEVKFI